MKKQKMNRHGGILHWGVLLITAGLIVFLGLSIKGSVTPGVKGEWVVTFLKEGYLEAQKVLLKNDIIAKNIGQEIAVELAANGGFPPETSSGCGRSKGRNFWNKEEQWCLPDVKNAVITQAQEKLALRLAGKTFTDIGYSSTFFFGKGSAETIKTNHGTYTFENGFSVDVGYSFAEYDQLTAEAQRLIKACRNKRNLQECVDGARNAGWKYASCDEEEFPSEGRQIPFCVVSSATQLSSPVLYLFILPMTCVCWTTPVQRRILLFSKRQAAFWRKFRSCGMKFVRLWSNVHRKKREKPIFVMVEYFIFWKVFI